MIDWALVQREYLPRILTMFGYGMTKEACHAKTNSGNSCIGAISDGAIGSNFKDTIYNVLSDVLAAIPAMRWLNYSLLQDLQFVHCTVSQHVSELS